MAFKVPPLKSILIAFVAAFFGIQIISLVLTAFFPSIGLFRGGPIILVMLLAVSIIGLLIIGIKLDELRKKENLIFIIILFGLVALAYWKLPDLIPQIFSISPETSNTIKEMVGRIVG